MTALSVSGMAPCSTVAICPAAHAATPLSTRTARWSIRSLTSCDRLSPWYSSSSSRASTGTTGSPVTSSRNSRDWSTGKNDTSSSSGRMAIDINGQDASISMAYRRDSSLSQSSVS